MTKQILRRRLRNKRNKMSEQMTAQKSALIHHRLLQIPVYQSAQRIAFYVAIKNEVRTQASIKKAIGEGKQVGVPVTQLEGIMEFQAITNLNELRSVQHGLREPAADPEKTINPQEMDLVIVPGIALDRHGHRIGSGGGYYDRYLSRTGATRIGLAYAFQIVDHITANPHDLKMDWIITENETLQTSSQ